MAQFSMDPARDSFGIEFDPPPRAYDDIWPLNPPGLLESTNLISAYVQAYHTLQSDWFQVMVRTAAFPSFLQAMDADEGRSRTLRFSCWCDAGLAGDPRFRQHRHMIIVSSPPGHFVENVWNKIPVPEGLPHEDFPYKLLQPIQSVLNLMNIIGEVSRRDADCPLMEEEAKMLVKHAEKNNQIEKRRLNSQSTNQRKMSGVEK